MAACSECLDWVEGEAKRKDGLWYCQRMHEFCDKDHPACVLIVEKPAVNLVLGGEE